MKNFRFDDDTPLEAKRDLAFRIKLLLWIYHIPFNISIGENNNCISIESTEQHLIN